MIKAEGREEVVTIKARFSVYPESQAKNDGGGLEVELREAVGRLHFKLPDMLISRNAFCATEITRTYVEIQFTNTSSGFVRRRFGGKEEPISMKAGFNRTRVYNGDKLVLLGTPEILGKSRRLELELLAEEMDPESAEQSLEWEPIGTK
jgi:hypothetical protein